MDKKTAINKIKKCLALAKSSEPNEAAAAMRQAQKLMEAFGIAHPELIAADACEEWSKSSAAHRPVRYEVALAGIVADAYGCELLFQRKLNAARTDIVGGYAFIGIDPAPEIARYTFDVYARHLRASRRTYIQTKLKRCGQRNKMARADEFCDGWVLAVRMQLTVAERSQEQRSIIDAYMRANHAELRKLDARSRSVSRRNTDTDRLAGFEQGASAVVNKGIRANNVRRIAHV